MSMTAFPKYMNARQRAYSGTGRSNLLWVTMWNSMCSQRRNASETSWRSSRENSLIRPAVANIDQAMIVFAVADPEPNLNLLDRFLVTMKAQDVPVVICFNKTDLGKEGEADGSLKSVGTQDMKFHLSCALEGDGIEAIHDLLRGKTTALAGPSGVGKSSLTNRIQPEAEMETGAVSEKIRRGRHTTRHSELFFRREGNLRDGYARIQLDLC